MSESKYSVTLGQIIKEFDLEVLCAAPNYEQVPLHPVDVNRPGLPLSGFFEHFDTKRLLLMGLTETAFVAGMTTEQRRESFERLLEYPVPGLIITRGWPFPSVWRPPRPTGGRCCAPRPRPLPL